MWRSAGFMRYRRSSVRSVGNEQWHDVMSEATLVHRVSRISSSVSLCSAAQRRDVLRVTASPAGPVGRPCLSQNWKACFYFIGDLSFGFMPVLFPYRLAGKSNGTPAADPDHVRSLFDQPFVIGRLFDRHRRRLSRCRGCRAWDRRRGLSVCATGCCFPAFATMPPGRLDWKNHPSAASTSRLKTSKTAPRCNNHARFDESARALSRAVAKSCTLANGSLGSSANPLRMTRSTSWLSSKLTRNGGGNKPSGRRPVSSS